VDDKESPPADSDDASGTSGDVESMLPNLPEPEVPPQDEAVAAKGMAEVAEPDAETGEEETGEEETGEEEAEDTRAPATLELTTAAREAKAALDNAERDEEEEPKPALPMQKPAPKWAQTSPAGEEEEEAAEGQEDGEKPAAARPMQKPTPEWAKTVPETAVPVTEAEAPINPDAKPAVPMAKEAPSGRRRCQSRLNLRCRRRQTKLPPQTSPLHLKSLSSRRIRP